MNRVVDGRVRRVPFSSFSCAPLRSASWLVAACVTCVSLFVGAEARAITFGFEFEDVPVTTTGVFTPLGGDMDLTGYLTLDPAAVDIDGSPDQSLFFDVVTDFSLSIGGIEFVDQSNLVAAVLAIDLSSFDSTLTFDLLFDSVLEPEVDVDLGNVRIVANYTPELQDDTIPDVQAIELRTLESVAFKGFFGIGPGPKAQFVPGADELQFSTQKGDFAPTTPPTAAPIPEPTAAFLFAGGLLLAGNAARRSRAAISNQK